MLVIMPIYDRIKLLPYFLKYYSSIGATKFVCGLYDGERNPLYEQIARYRSKYDICIKQTMDARTTDYCAEAEMIGLNKIRENFSRRFKWYCIADLDEFHRFDCQTMPEMVRISNKCGYEAVRGVFLDRIAVDGTFPEIKGRLDPTFPLGCELTRCTGMRVTKIALAKSHVKISRGHHRADAIPWPFGVEVHHFKWSKGVTDSIKKTHARYLKLDRKWANRTMSRLWGLIEDGIDIHDPILRVRVAEKLGI